jgi:hypothetical protein
VRWYLWMESMTEGDEGIGLKIEFIYIKEIE